MRTKLEKAVGLLLLVAVIVWALWIVWLSVKPLPHPSPSLLPATIQVVLKIDCYSRSYCEAAEEGDLGNLRKEFCNRQIMIADCNVIGEQ